MLLSVTIHELTGSATQCTNTESFVDSHLLERNTEVFVVRDTATTRLVLLEEPPGRGTTLSPFVVTVDKLQSYYYMVVSVVLSLVLKFCFRDIEHCCLRVVQMFLVNYGQNRAFSCYLRYLIAWILISLFSIMFNCSSFVFSKCLKPEFLEHKPEQISSQKRVEVFLLWLVSFWRDLTVLVVDRGNFVEIQ